MPPKIKQTINIIAEIANAHQGSPEIAIELARAAVESGASSIKFQIYFAEELLTRNHPRFSHFDKQAFTKETWNKLLHKVKEFGVEVYADVFGLEALELAIKHNIDGIKVHSSDLINVKLLDQISYFKGKVFLAVGGSSLIEIKYAIDHIDKWGAPSEVILLHGFQAYPTKVADSKLDRIRVLRELFPKYSVGYMDHIDADSRFSTILPLLSIPYGAVYLEKHITFNRSEKGVDYYSSLEPEEFRQFVNFSRLAVSAVGASPLEFSESERGYRDTVKKSWVLDCSKNSGDIIKSEDLIMKRTINSTSPPFFEEIVNQNVNRSLVNEDLVNKDSVNQKVLAVIVARSKSSRLPGKAMAELAGEPAIGHLLKRVFRAKEKGIIDNIAFCTTKESSDDQLAEYVSNFPVSIYRGEVKNVLSRMLLAVNDFNNHNVVLRITGDDVLIDTTYLDKTIKKHLKTNSHYTDAKKLPSGTEVEVFDATVLQLISELSNDPSGTEYLTNYIIDNPDQFKTSSLDVPEHHDLDFRLTIDTKEDFSLVSSMLNHFVSIGKHYSYSIDDIVEFIESNPKLAKINKKIRQRQKPINVDSGLYWNSYTNLPLVTIYITNYNYGQYIRQSIESVLNQSFSSFELIIIDDGSSDESREIIQEYSRNSKVKIVFQQNKGLNKTNNIALKLSRGKYIMRLDADDYLHESALLLMTNRLENDSKLAMIFPDYYMVDKEGRVLSHEYRHDFSNKVSLYDQPAHGACTMVKSDVLKEVGGYSEEFKCQDGYELWVKIIGYYKVSNISLPLFYYRQHGDNLTSNEKKILSTRNEIIKKYSKLKIKRKLNNLCIIPIRANGDTRGALAIIPFAKTTLLEIVVKQLNNCDNSIKIVITTNDSKVYEYAKTKLDGENIIIDSRPEELSLLNTKIDDTIKYIVNKYAENLNKFNPDTISVVNYEYPLRGSGYIDNIANSLFLYNATSSLSVIKRTGNLFHHNGHTLIESEHNTDLRLERDEVYEEKGGLHCIKYADFLETKTLRNNRTTHVLLDQYSSMKVESDIDFEVLEHLYSKKNL
ncbi:N-acetylneuraminate synthase family protein [Candidatus Pseudothioglobus singularis]|nr:N-acetylneuraminate synthase family protein [Candidatus Pseudothioglobus singularis]